MSENRNIDREVFSPEFLSCLIDVARLADWLVDCVLNGRPNAEVMRQIIIELYNLENHASGNLLDISAHLIEAEFDRAEIVDGDIWIYEKQEEEEACPAKT